MRLVSQDGRWDIPYEKVIVAMDTDDPISIRAYDDVRVSRYIELARYDDITDARLALEKMRVAYKTDQRYFYFYF